MMSSHAATIAEPTSGGMSCSSAFASAAAFFTMARAIGKLGKCEIGMSVTW